MLQPASFTSLHAYPLGVSIPDYDLHGHGPGLGQTIQQETGQIGSAVASGLFFIPGVGPLAAAATAAATAVAIVIEGFFKGCGDTCIQATHIADATAQQLQKNLDNWRAVPPDARFASVQAAHLAVFDRAWQLLVEACGNPALGAAGQRCISERQRGGVAPWCPNPGHAGCDWWILYRDPIANDPSVIPDPSFSPSPSDGSPVLQAVTNPDGSVSYIQVSPATSQSGFPFPLPLIIGLAALGAAFSLLGGK